MKTKLLLIIINLLFFNGFVFSQSYSGGNGLSGTPYQIANEADLSYLASHSADWGKHFIQTANIVMSANHTPIGNSTTSFTGSYDGDEYTITSLSVSQTADYAGMFGYVDGAEIKDLSLASLNVSGGDDYVGGLAGYATGATITNISVSGSVSGKYNLGGMIGEAENTVISNCAASAITVNSTGGTDAGSNIGGLIGVLSTTGSGSVSSSSSSGTVNSDGAEDVGGLIGESQVNVTNCSSSANVDAVDYVGGLIGFPDGGTISNSHSTGTVEGDEYVGGFLGDADACTIQNCYSTGTVSIDGSDEDYIGGFIGRADACTISGSYSSGNVSGDDWTGGFIGYALNGCDISTSYCIATTVNGYHYTGGFIGRLEASDVTQCYATANVNAEGEDVGGFIGVSEDASSVFPNVTRSYSSGNVVGTDTDSDDVGGFIGENWGLVENCYSRGDVSNTGGSDSDWFGAFMGNNKGSGTVRYCYTTGDYTTAVGAHGFIWGNSGTATANFYDSDESSQTSGTGATPKTTALMKIQNTFTNAGWNFTTIWAISSTYNNGYPNLNNTSDFQWTGTTSTAWQTGTNWNKGSAPGENDIVTIPDLANDPIIGSGVQANAMNLTIAEDAVLTIQSGGSLITTGTITNNGTVNMQKSISQGAWHLISIPCTGITSNIFLDDYLQSWNEAGSNWSDIVETTELLNIKQGYSLWPVASKANTTYTFTGTPLTGNQSISITASGSGESAGMNLVGNPYPSSIDWNELDESYGTVYYWDSQNGHYDTWSGSGNTNGGQQYLPPMQGFFVYTTSPKSFSLSNACRTHSNATSFYKNTAIANNSIRLQAAKDAVSTDMLLIFNEGALPGFEIETDAWKILSGTEGLPELYSYENNERLALNVRPMAETIQLGFAVATAGTYSIGISEIADINTAILEDSKLNIFHDLTEGDYSFDWSLNDAETRFKLHFNTTAVEDINSNAMQVYVAGGNIIIQSGTQPQLIILTDITGRTLGLSENAQQIPAPKTSGVYLVTVESENQQITKKIIIE